MRDIQVIKKVKYDYGVNTFIEYAPDGLVRDYVFILSSMKMSDGTTTYNLYLNEINSDNLLIEDYEEGYYALVKLIKHEKLDDLETPAQRRANEGAITEGNFTFGEAVEEEKGEEMKILELAEVYKMKKNAEARAEKIEAVEDELAKLWDMDDDGQEDRAKYQQLFHEQEEIAEACDDVIKSMNNANYSEGYNTVINGEDVIVYYYLEGADNE